MRQTPTDDVTAISEALDVTDGLLASVTLTSVTDAVICFAVDVEDAEELTSDDVAAPSITGHGLQLAG